MKSIDELIDDLLTLAFAEDVGDGDHTTLSTIPADAKGRQRLIVKEEDKNHVEKTYAVVVPSAYFYSHFFEQAHAGCCLAGVKHLSRQSFQFLLVACGGCSYAAHALHYVQHYALGL